MPADMGSKDMLVFGVIFVIILLLVLIVDFIIFCYWISFKYKEYSFEQAYGPVITFPPRETGQHTDSLPGITSDLESDITPDVQHPTSLTIAPSAYDFLPTAVPLDKPVEDEQVSSSAPEVEVETEDFAEPSQQNLMDASQSFEDKSIPDSEIEQTVSASPLEDTRPIDPALIGAYGGIRSPFARTWSLVHPFVGIQVILAAVNILSLIFLIPVFSRLITDPKNLVKTTYFMAVTIICLFAQNAGFVGITAYLLKGYGTSLKRIGFRAPTGREIGLGLVYGAGLCIAAVLLEQGLDSVASHFVSRHFMERMGKLNDSLSAGGMFEQIHRVSIQIWFIIAGAVAAPIGEEVFFRGLLYNGLKNRWGMTAGVVLSGICFGLIHFAPIAVIIIIPMGCVLAIVYERTKSLWVTILMHAVNNGAQLLFAMYTINHVTGHK